MYPLTYFVRHGQTDWNAEQRLQGQADTDLNATGRAQADRNGERLAGLIEDAGAFDYVSSPLTRTRDTMERIREKLGLPADGYRTDKRLVELDFGEWQGFTMAELDARTPGVSAARDRDKWNFLPPGAGAESYEMLSRRVRPWLDELERPTVCVTHGGIIRCMFRLIGGMDETEAADLDIRQDRVVRLANGRLEWL